MRRTARDTKANQGHSSTRRHGALFLLGALLSTLIVIGPGHFGATKVEAASYNSTVTADSPAIYWRLDEGSGTTAADSSGNGRTGTYAGSGITYGVTGAIAGDSDTAISTTSSSTPVSTTASILGSGNASRTIETWFKTSTSGAYQGLIDLGPSGNRFEVLLNTSDELWVYADSVTGGFTVAPPYSIVDNNWHYVAVTYDGTTAALYLDGMLLHTGTFSGALTTGAGLYVGNDPGGAPFTGGLDEAAAYTSPLSAGQIASHWTSAGPSSSCPTTPSTGYGGTVVGDSPARYYRLDESASSRVARDYSGNCVAGTYSPYGITYGATGAISGDSDGAITSASSAAAVTTTASILGSGNGNRTIEAWFKTSTSATTQGIIDLGPYGSRFEVLLNTSNQLWVYADSVTGSFTVTPPYSVVDNNWHYVAVTYDGTTAALYLDGLLLHTGTFSGALTTGAGLYVGNDPGGAALSGSLDEAAAYTSPLAAGHIKAHFMASGHTVPLIHNVTASESNTNSNASYSCSCVNPHGSVGPNPIDPESGNFWHTFTDISIPGRSYPLAVGRSYNSQNAATNGPFGYGWQSHGPGEVDIRAYMMR